MAFSCLKWKEDVDRELEDFITKSRALAEEYNDPFTIRFVFKSILEEYERILKESGPFEVPKIH